MTSGCVDAISFLGLGQVFTAAMTGNTVLFGLAIARTHGLAALSYAVALLGFVIGAMIGAVILGRNPKKLGWSPVVTVTLGFELAALILFAVLTASSEKLGSGSMNDLLITILAIAMGLQGVAARRIGVNGVTTTVITSTLTGLVETIVWKVGAVVTSPGKRDVAQNPASAVVPLSSIWMWFSVIIAYGIGAAICGSVELRWGMQAIWLPIAVVFVVIASAMASEMRARVYFPHSGKQSKEG